MSDMSQEVDKTPLTPAERKAAQRLRDKASGMVEITVKVPHDRIDDARAWCSKLKPKRPFKSSREPLPDLFDEQVM